MLAALLCGPEAAPAATVAVEPPREGRPAARILVADRTGEVNDVTLAYEGRAARRQPILVRDAAAALTAGAGCTAVDARAVRCDVTGVGEVAAELGGGDDRLRLDGGADAPWIDWILAGEAGDDRLVTELGGFLYGGGGDDRISALGSAVSADGGAGDDVIDVSNGGYIGGGPGDDVLRGGDGRDALAGGDLLLRAGEPSEPGPAGRDRLDGGGGDDELFDGDAGFGVEVEEVGPDVLIGGTGDDSVYSYVSRRRSVRVDLSDRGGDGERGENDRLSGLENVVGGHGGDRLTGDGDANRLEGGAGADVLRGRGGDDFLAFDPGDQVAGDRGDDVLQSPLSFDRRIPCGPGLDRVVLDADQRGRGVPRGPLLDPDCERLQIPHRGLLMESRPSRAAGGRLAFRIFSFRCCGLGLTLTRNAPGYRVIGRGRIVDDRVLIAPSAQIRGATLRGIVSSRYGPTVRWRFRAPAG